MHILKFWLYVYQYSAFLNTRSVVAKKTIIRQLKLMPNLWLPNAGSKCSNINMHNHPLSTDTEFYFNVFDFCTVYVCFLSLWAAGHSSTEQNQLMQCQWSPARFFSPFNIADIPGIGGSAGCLNAASLTRNRKSGLDLGYWRYQWRASVAADPL